MLEEERRKGAENIDVTEMLMNTMKAPIGIMGPTTRLVVKVIAFRKVKVVPREDTTEIVDIQHRQHDLCFFLGVAGGVKGGSVPSA